MAVSTIIRRAAASLSFLMGAMILQQVNVVSGCFTLITSFYSGPLQFLMVIKFGGTALFCDTQTYSERLVHGYHVLMGAIFFDLFAVRSYL